MKYLILTLAFVAHFSLAQELQTDWARGSWIGMATSGQEQTRIRVNVRAVSPEAYIDIDLLDIGVIGIPTRNASISPTMIEFQIPSGSGLQPVVLERENNSLTGVWLEAGRDDANLRLARTDLFVIPNEQQISVRGDAGNLGLSIILPEQTPPVAGVVFVHGSGPETRDASRFAAIRLAESGIASAFYDKRGTGESEGDWQTADFYDLSADVIAVTEVLANTTGLQENQIGLIGTSQGGWIAPLAASMSDALGFLITISGPATTPREEGHWNVVRELRLGGFGEDTVSQAEELMSLWDQGVTDDGDFSDFILAMNAARNEEWFEETSLEQLFSTQLPGWFIGWYQAIMNFDPLPILRQLTIPMLAILGDQDEEQPWDKTAELLEALAEEGKDISVHIYDNTNHAMRLLSPSGESSRWPERPENFFERQINFIMKTIE